MFVTYVPGVQCLLSQFATFSVVHLSLMEHLVKINLEVKQILELLARKIGCIFLKCAENMLFDVLMKVTCSFQRNIVIDGWHSALSRQTQPMDCKQFLLLWKAVFLIFTTCPWLEQLKGYYFKWKQQAPWFST